MDETVHSTIENIIKQYIHCDKEVLKGIGRYEGWMLICGQEAKVITYHFELCKKCAADKGYHLIRWSSLSYDEDDRNDFGLRKGFDSL